MTPAEELFLDRHEALHYAIMLQHTMHRNISAVDITDLNQVSRRLRKKQVTHISSFIVIAELDLLRQEQKTHIAGFNKIVDFIVANWTTKRKQTEEPNYADMTAEEAYTTLLNIKQV